MMKTHRTAAAALLLTLAVIATAQTPLRQPRPTHVTRSTVFVHVVIFSVKREKLDELGARFPSLKPGTVERGRVVDEVDAASRARLIVVESTPSLIVNSGQNGELRAGPEGEEQWLKATPRIADGGGVQLDYDIQAAYRDGGRLKLAQVKSSARFSAGTTLVTRAPDAEGGRKRVLFFCIEAAAASGN
jgi:hypothetical protein